MYSFKNCLIIGAGISGLLAAHRLKSHGIEVTLIDKGRQAGGRLATRVINKAVFDHGAQFITTREKFFRELVESWMDRGVAKPWYKGPLGNMRYVGASGMSAVGKHLAKGLKIHQSERVSYIHFEKDQWQVTTVPHGEEETKHYQTDFLILTAPIPQSLTLVKNSNIEIDYDEEEELEKVRYTKCITVLAKLNGPAGLPQPGAMDLNLDVLRWLGDNSYKGISPIEGSLTINSSPKFAQAHWDSPDEVRIPLMLSAARPFIRSEVLEATAHRWGYSEPLHIYKEKHPFRKPFFVDGLHRLGMCGDGFAGGRLEAAAMSGKALADELTRAV